MVTEDTRNRLVLVVAIVLLAAGFFILDAGISGDFPPILGIEQAYIGLALLQLLAGVILLARVRNTDTFSMSE